jgi:hypothetical protein
MSAVNAFPSHVPPRPIYRVGRCEEVWSWPDWANVGADRTFGNRYDDCEGLYRVLYGGSQRYACYLETLARFRPDLSVYAEWDAIEGDDDHPPPGLIDADWREKRRVGSATAGGDHADVYHSVWIAAFRRSLAAEAQAAKCDDFDAHTLYASAPRSLTQSVSRMVFENHYAGIRYLSKYGLDAEIWALFETRVEVEDPREVEIAADDPELLAAMAVHDIVFGP